MVVNWLLLLRLPVDIYQTAKVSKLLIMMEKGSLPAEFKGKSWSEIEFDENTEYPEEHNEGKERCFEKCSCNC